MIKRYFIAGLLVWVPVWITLLVINFIAELMDKTLALLPHPWQPDHLFGFHIPGLGLVFTVLLVLLTGVFATNILGNKLVALGESLLQRIPFIRSIYSGSKQIMQTLFKPEGEAFKKVLLVKFPQQNIWSLAFQTGVGFAEAQQKTGEELVSVFVPTTPNPTAGFYMLIPRKETIELDLPVESAFKMIISLGVVTPDKFSVDTTRT